MIQRICTPCKAPPLASTDHACYSQHKLCLAASACPQRKAGVRHAELPTGGGLKTLSRARRRRTAAGALASADG